MIQGILVDQVRPANHSSLPFLMAVPQVTYIRFLHSMNANLPQSLYSHSQWVIERRGNRLVRGACTYRLFDANDNHQSGFLDHHPKSRILVEKRVL